jgi:hypothetical protein
VVLPAEAILEAVRLFGCPETPKTLGTFYFVSIAGVAVPEISRLQKFTQGSFKRSR